MGGTAWPHERPQARRFADHALMCAFPDRLTLETRASSKPRVFNGAATNKTACVRCPDQARTVGDPGTNQPHETDGSNPSLLWRRSLAQSEDSGPFESRPVCRGTNVIRSSGRNRAIGTHFPTVVALAVAERAKPARRLAVRLRPVLPAAIARAAAWDSRPRLAVFPTKKSNVGKRVTRSSGRGSHATARSAGLGSVTLKPSTAQPLGCHCAQLNCWT
jgi:hypothetical protein